MQRRTRSSLFTILIFSLFLGPPLVYMFVRSHSRKPLVGFVGLLLVWLLLSNVVNVILAPINAVSKLLLCWNAPIAKNNWVDKLLADIDAALKKRYDLVPNLVAVVKQYMRHEADTLVKLAELRSQRPPRSQPDLDNQLAGAMTSVFVAAEGYPSLKANQNFLELQRSLGELENELMRLRLRYTDAVTQLNNTVEQFPSSIAARIRKVKRRELIEIPAAQRANPDTVTASTPAPEAVAGAVVGSPEKGFIGRMGTVAAVAEGMAGPPAIFTGDVWRVPSLASFSKFVESEVLGGLDGLEEQRRHAARVRRAARLLSILLSLALVAAIVPVAVSYSPGLAVAFLCTAIVSLWVGQAVRNRELARFRPRFKTELVSRLVRFFGELTYHPERCVDLEWMRSSGLFNCEGAPAYQGEDFVVGMAGKTLFQSSEVEYSSEQTYTDDDGSERTSTELLFKGLFFVGDFNKAFQGYTLVIPHDHLLQWGEPVSLEDPEFAELFSVRSDDQVFARYVLSPALMRRMVEYRRKVEHRVFFSFRDGMLYVAVETSHDMFEPDLTKPLDVAQCVRLFEDTYDILGIVEELNLNTRIWNKA